MYEISRSPVYLCDFTLIVRQPHRSPVALNVHKQTLAKHCRTIEELLHKDVNVRKLYISKSNCKLRAVMAFTDLVCCDSELHAM